MMDNKAKNKASFFRKLISVRDRFPVVFFLSGFIFMFFLFYRLFYIEYLEVHLHPKIIYATAYLPYLFLNAIGANVSFVDGATLLLPGFSLNVIIDCCSIEPMAIFSAAVITYPASLFQKIKGIMVSLPIFFTVNIIRIVSLYFFGTYAGLPTMERMHLGIWQALLLLFSVTLFLFWLNWTSKYKKQSKIAN